MTHTKHTQSRPNKARLAFEVASRMLLRDAPEACNVRLRPVRLVMLHRFHVRHFPFYAVLYAKVGRISFLGTLLRSSDGLITRNTLVHQTRKYNTRIALANPSFVVIIVVSGLIFIRNRIVKMDRKFN